jgi:pimeloyl-ACP methyl ester carboxylesterase
MLASCAAPANDAFSGSGRGESAERSAVSAEFAFTPSASAPIKVFMQRPATIDASTQIVIALHGASRGASATFSAWKDSVGTRNLIIVAPLFAEADYPSGQYSEGNTANKSSGPTPPASWTFHVIEELFDHVRKTTGATTGGYILYGHSAGGQFTHRMVMMMPQTRMTQAYAANAGWYLMPDANVNYPYGLQGAPVNAMTSCLGYSRKMTVMLGEADTDPNHYPDPNHYQLRRTKEAMRQGANRFARGMTFFETAKRDAATRNCAFNWTLHTVPGAAHEQEKMAAATALLLKP